MSYTSKRNQKAIDDQLEKLPIASPGELQYCLTKIILNYIAPSKETIPDRFLIASAVGVLGMVQAEIYRKLITPFENTAQLTNGDTFQEIIKNSKLRTL